MNEFKFEVHGAPGLILLLFSVVILLSTMMGLKGCNGATLQSERIANIKAITIEKTGVETIEQKPSWTLVYEMYNGEVYELVTVQRLLATATKREPKGDQR